MRLKKLGNTGLFVSELCLGTMTFGGNDGMWKQIGALDQSQAEGLVRAAIDAGINFLDTANVYAAGASEEITGQALKNLGIARDKIVIATKGFGSMGEGANQRGNSRGHLIDACKASLKRLQIEHIDLYQIHGFDPATPIEETMAALDTLVQHGHVRYIAVSNWAAWQIMKALGIAQRRGFHSIVSLQAYYTLAGRELEREIVPMLQAENVGLLVWSPLAGGYLSGKYSGDGEKEAGRRAAFDFPPIPQGRGDAVIAAMRPIAEAHGVSLAQIAIAWLLHQPAVTSVIIGAKRADQLADNIAATKVALTPDDLAALDAASALPGEYPGWMFEMQGKYRRDQIAQQSRS